MRPSFRLQTILLLITLLIAACAEVPTAPVPQPSPQERLQQRAAESISRAQSSVSPLREALLIEAAKLYVQLNDKPRVKQTLESIDPTQLSAQQVLDYALLYSDVLLEQGDYFAARDLLTDARLETLLADMPLEQKIAWHGKRADLFSLLGEDQSATKEYIALSHLQASPEAITATHEKIWQLLIDTPDTTLSTLEAAATNRALQGWYNLALLGRQYQGDLRQWAEQLKLWHSRWPGHPAVLFPPTSQRVIEAVANAVPGQLALLLPLSGKYARAGLTIRDGFLRAYYNILENEGITAPLNIYDTNSADIIGLYQQAVAGGAEIVIGPLRKENLAALAALPELSTPLIGLNYLSDSDQTDAPAHDKLLQFGLSVDDEARQIAQRAWLEGHRSALLITPDTKWAATAREAFHKYWTALGGRLISATPYSLKQTDFSATVRPALLLDQSQQRAIKLRRTLGKSIEMTAQRRRDIDMVFIIAYPDQGRQIKPTLDFYYAHDLPTYATSHIYTGTENPGRNRDLEGIRFSAMPWTIPGTVSDKLKPSATLKSTYRNLFALGVDAYQLHQWADMMRAYPQTPFFGHTGTLTLGAHDRIQHSYPWAEFYRGKVRLAPELKAD
ncbi:MAG: penicillin-binding protein activator [Gammaproteobacteria bacterium]|nr:penicillin-binding protein activator [Gammaproteobacteria bacterium]MBQ0838255.1 penicillin-binding protein activator [Gammaproteobacteria bacterium]